MIAELGATGIVCDDELSPAQLKNLEQMLDTKVMDRTLIILDIFKGDETPYYYSGDGTMEAYVRVGNESVKATATELKRLVLRRKNTSYDSSNFNV